MAWARVLLVVLVFAVPSLGKAQTDGVSEEDERKALASARARYLIDRENARLSMDWQEFFSGIGSTYQWYNPKQWQFGSENLSPVFGAFALPLNVLAGKQALPNFKRMSGRASLGESAYGVAFLGMVAATVYLAAVVPTDHPQWFEDIFAYLGPLAEYDTVSSGLLMVYYFLMAKGSVTGTVLGAGQVVGHTATLGFLATRPAFQRASRRLAPVSYFSGGLHMTYESIHRMWWAIKSGEGVLGSGAGALGLSEEEKEPVKIYVENVAGELAYLLGVDKDPLVVAKIKEVFNDWFFAQTQDLFSRMEDIQRENGEPAIPSERIEIAKNSVERTEEWLESLQTFKPKDLPKGNITVTHYAQLEFLKYQIKTLKEWNAEHRSRALARSIQRAEKTYQQAKLILDLNQ